MVPGAVVGPIVLVGHVGRGVIYGHVAAVLAAVPEGVRGVLVGGRLAVMLRRVVEIALGRVGIGGARVVVGRAVLADGHVHLVVLDMSLGGVVGATGPLIDPLHVRRSVGGVLAGGPEFALLACRTSCCS